MAGTGISIWKEVGLRMCAGRRYGMAMNPEREKKRRRRLHRSMLLIMLLSLYAGLWLGADWARYEGDFSALYDGLLHDLIGIHDHPWRFLVLHGERLPGVLILTPAQWLWGLAGMAGGALLCLSEYTTYLLNRNTRPGEEHGSAQFGSDYSALLTGYVMSPRIIAKWREEKLKKVSLRKGESSLPVWLTKMKLRHADRSRKAAGGRRV